MARRKPTPKKKKARTPARRGGAISLGEPQRRWLDSIADGIAANGGPRFSRTEILGALIDANTGRTIDHKAIESLESLRVAFGAPDLSKVERALQERPKLEPGVLDALKDSIK